MRAGSRDAVLDGLAMAEAYLRGDEEGLNALLSHGDPVETARSLAIMLACSIQGAVRAARGIPVDGEPAADEVFATVAKLRESLSAQYDLRLERRGA